MSKKVIITGASGMVGMSVLQECIASPEIDQILLINRSALGLSHKKVKEVLLPDFENVGQIKDELQGHQACFHCMGVSAVGKSELEYERITYHLTKLLVDLLYELNPKMTFIYVSGAGTDSSEKGRIMWARVKGKTENYLLTKGFEDAYAFRPGAILPAKGIKSKTGWYNLFYVLFRPFFPLMRKMESVTTSEKIGRAMIAVVLQAHEDKILENKDINQLSSTL